MLLWIQMKGICLKEKASMIWIVGHPTEFAWKTCRVCADLSFHPLFYHAAWILGFLPMTNILFPIGWLSQNMESCQVVQKHVFPCFSNFALCKFNCAPNVKRQNSYKLANCCPAYPSVFRKKVQWHNDISWCHIYGIMNLPFHFDYT